MERSINSNDAFSAAPYQQPRILFDHVRLVSMVSAEIKVAFTHEVIANAAHDQSVIPIAQFRDQHADGEGALFAERACEQAWLVIEFPGSGAHSLARLRGNGTSRNVVEHHGNRGGTDAEIVRENLQADRFFDRRLVFLPGNHG